jgi:hypothetical protein
VVRVNAQGFLVVKDGLRVAFAVAQAVTQEVKAISVVGIGFDKLFKADA